MTRSLNELRPVYVVGIGWHRYQNPSETPYVALGLTAIPLILLIVLLVSMAITALDRKSVV